MDGFAPPAEDPTHQPTGTIDAGAALATGIAAAARNAFQIIAVLIYMVVAFTVSCCSVVLLPLTYPMIMWGVAAWTLSAIDGEGDLTLLWTSVTEDPVLVLKRGWAWLLLLMVAMIPLYVVIMPISFMSSMADSLQEALLWSLAQQIPTMLFMVLLFRHYQSFWLLVERRYATLDAISTNWQNTSPSWMPLAGLALLYSALGLPYQILVAWQSYELQQLPPAQMLDGIGMFYAVIYGGAGILSLIGMVMLFVFAAAHRQLYPEPPAERV